MRKEYMKKTYIEDRFIIEYTKKYKKTNKDGIYRMTHKE